MHNAMNYQSSFSDFSFHIEIISDGLMIDIPVIPPTTSIRIILSGLVKSTFRFMFAAADVIISLLDNWVKRFSTVTRNVSFSLISVDRRAATFSISKIAIYGISQWKRTMGK